MYADDANLYSIYERLEKIGMPTLVSAGGTIGPDFGYVDPKYLHRVAKDFPKLKLIIGHGGWPYVMQALAVAYDCANVYLSPDMYLNVPNMPGNLEYVRAANYYLRERLIFGTAYPARPMIESIGHFHRLPFDEEVKPYVLYHNAARVFGI
jgi:predicted TIM-barrel fold metal-dependent hydrolase